MARKGAERLLILILTALALASLPVVFLSSDDKPASLNLPPFEKEVYLSVSAKWAPNDCVDVTVVTNLPEGTVYEIAAQSRRKPGTLRAQQPADRIFGPTKSMWFAATPGRMDFRNSFCGLVKARKKGGKRDTYGLLIVIGVAHRAYLLPEIPFDQATEEQALRIGRNGSLLRGPLARHYIIDSTPRTDAESKTFVLEPLPMLPEDEESEQTDETGVDSE